VIELHRGDIPERLEPFISVTVTGDKAMDDKIEEMAQAYSIACLVHTPIAQRNAAPLGSMFGKLIARGVPTMLTEFVGEIRDYFGNKIKDITSPIDGMITVVRTSPSVGVPQVLLELHHVN
jgi:hypothetical protein